MSIISSSFLVNCKYFCPNWLFCKIANVCICLLLCHPGSRARCMLATINWPGLIQTRRSRNRQRFMWAAHSITDTDLDSKLCCFVLSGSDCEWVFWDTLMHGVLCREHIMQCSVGLDTDLSCPIWGTYLCIYVIVYLHNHVFVCIVPSEALGGTYLCICVFA